MENKTNNRENENNGIIIGLQTIKIMTFLLLILIPVIIFSKYSILIKIILISIIVFLLYLLLPLNKATEDFEKKFSNCIEGIDFSREGSTIVISPKKTETAIIFYQGGFVENKAYIPLLLECAKKGIKIYLIHFPLNFGFFRPNIGIKIVKSHPEIKHWYIGGHSLGGLIAALHVLNYPDAYEGLFMLAGYSMKDISNLKMKVLTICGSNDGIIRFEKYNENNKKLPKHMKKYVIEGGNHSQFGNYGFQKGDKKATISREEQQAQAVKYIVDFIQKEKEVN